MESIFVKKSVKPVLLSHCLAEIDGSCGHISKHFIVSSYSFLHQIVLYCKTIGLLSTSLKYEGDATRKVVTLVDEVKIGISGTLHTKVPTSSEEQNLVENDIYRVKRELSSAVNIAVKNSIVR